jgi:hypothetical protein
MTRIHPLADPEPFFVNCNVSLYNYGDCPPDNIIYVFRSKSDFDPYEYWKINLDLLNKLSLLSFFNEEEFFFCSNTTPLNEKGYAILSFENNYCSHHFSRNRIILSMLYYKIKFSFDEVYLQNIFDELTEDQQIDYTQQFDYVHDKELEKMGYNISPPPDDLYDFILDNIDTHDNIDPKFRSLNNWNDVFNEIDIYLFKIQSKWKKEKAKYKRRETKYRNLGCEILYGADALEAIKRSYSYSMVAIDTDEIYSIEYSGSGYYCSDLDDTEFYTVRRFVDNQIKKESMWWFLLPNISNYKWAIKKYHTGIHLYHPDY